ncbi:MAG: protein-tyrosine-phosphatase [Xanthomonadales bacterium]|nr:protein-tyrosine-phosphatase [Xanthomonadales bacterium]
MNLRTLAPVWLALVCACAHGEPREVAPWQWEGVERIVAVGDLHGDYEQYMKVLRSAGLVNARGKWTGGETHLVQTGDVPDRGPDTRRIIDHLADLKEQAERKGGRVHTLIGNHEAMNSYGDVRYVHPGEFEAFRGRDSKRLQQLQWEHYLSRLKQVRPEAFLTMDLDKHRAEWERKVPLGWVEHRLAWAPEGEYGQWVLSNPVIVRVNDTLFLHGGIGPAYCHLGIEEINRRAHAELRAYDPETRGVIDDEHGPLWYRGLATENEATFGPVLAQILERYGASRIVVGHTPTGGVVWPRFNGRVVVNDTGIAAYYGGHDAYLEIRPDGVFAGYGELKLPLPRGEVERLDYLRAVIELDPENGELKKLLSETQSPATGDEVQAGAETDEATGEPAVADHADAVSPGICQ